MSRTEVLCTYGPDLSRCLEGCISFSQYFSSYLHIYTLSSDRSNHWQEAGSEQMHCIAHYNYTAYLALLGDDSAATSIHGKAKGRRGLSSTRFYFST